MELEQKKIRAGGSVGGHQQTLGITNDWISPQALIDAVGPSAGLASSSV